MEYLNKGKNINHKSVLKTIFVDCLRYAYNKNYYVDYFNIKNIDFSKIYIERTDILEDYEEDYEYGFMTDWDYG